MKKGFLLRRPDILSVDSKPVQQATSTPTQAKADPRHASPGPAKAAELLDPPAPREHYSAVITDINEMISMWQRAGQPMLSSRLCRQDGSSNDAFCVWLTYKDLFDATPGPPGGWGPNPPLPEEPTFEIVDVPGAGKGMVAVRDIELGESILKERPIFIMSQILDPSGSDPIKIFEQALQHMPPKLMDQFYGLSNCKSKRPRDIKGILDTNTLPLNFDGIKHIFDYGGIFPLMSRCNHSCGPNGVFGFDHRTLTMELRAGRAIKKGEPITLHYVPLHHPRATRQTHLRDSYSFICKCEYCTKPKTPQMLDASNKRRERAGRNLDAEFAGWLSREKKDIGWVEQVIKMSREAEMEGLETVKASSLHYAALAYAALGDEENFKIWAEKSLPYTRVHTRLERFTNSTEMWKAAMQNPQRLKVWGKKAHAE